MYLPLIANVYFTPFYSDTFVIQIPICRAEGGFFRNVAEISIPCKICGARVLIYSSHRKLIDFRDESCYTTLHERIACRYFIPG